MANRGLPCNFFRLSTVTPTNRSTARQGLLSYDVLLCNLPDLFSPDPRATSTDRLHGRYVRFSGATSGQSSIPLRAPPDLLREDPQQSESKRHSGALTGLRGRTGHRLSPGDRGVLQPGEESFVFRLTVFPDAWSGSIAMSGPVMMLIIHRVGLLDLISMTERTSPVTIDPIIVTVVF